MIRKAAAMPLSVPLVLTPGHPERHYTVHLHRVRWGAPNASVPLTADHLTALGTNAEQGLRMISACLTAELPATEVEVTEYADGSAEAVARVLCTEDTCAAVAEQYHRDPRENAEAESARAWAAIQLRDQTVELMALRGELERTTPGATPASVKDMLAAALADQQERAGAAPGRVVLMLDECAYLARQSGLVADGTPEGAREQIEQLIRQGRTPYPAERRWGKTAPWDLGIMPPPSDVAPAAQEDPLRPAGDATEDSR
jgi:hypothetical protein